MGTKRSPLCQPICSQKLNKMPQTVFPNWHRSKAPNQIKTFPFSHGSRVDCAGNNTQANALCKCARKESFSTMARSPKKTTLPTMALFSVDSLFIKTFIFARSPPLHVTLLLLLFESWVFFPIVVSQPVSSFPKSMRGNQRKKKKGWSAKERKITTRPKAAEKKIEHTRSINVTPVMIVY